jgi:bile acid-coenzyme A ligase
MGVGQDDLVTIALPNGIEFYEAAVAAWKLGATPQPVSAKLPPRELDAIIELASPPIVVGRDVPAGFEPDPGLPDDPLPDRVAASWKAPTSGGSTGRPKLIVAGQPGTTDPEVASPGLGLHPGDVQLVPGPLYHNAPFAFSSNGLFSGGHLVVMSRFDASEALRLLAEHHVQWVLLVPTMMLRIWRLPEEERAAADLSALRAILHLAAPCPPWLKEAWIDWLGPERVIELYAGTEAQGVTIINGQEWLEHRGSVGRPVGSEMKVLDPETGEELPPGEIGEVWMRSHAERPTYRYIGAEARRDDDGWESLGDLGSLDADGYLYLADRRTDLILSGGANVYPAEVEAALDEHPAVRSCAVVGIPDDDLGRRVHAIVQVAGPAATVDDLRAHLTERLARYKIPRTFELVEEPVRDDAGKVRRSALAEERS